MAQRVKLLKARNNGGNWFGVGDVIEVSDHDAKCMAEHGCAVIVDPTTPCKKGAFNADDYLTCTTPKIKTIPTALELNTEKKPERIFAQAKHNATKK